MIPPIDQDIWSVAVQAPRRTIGTTSEAYAGEFAMKRPHGMPSSNWPTVRRASELALIILLVKHKNHIEKKLTKNETKIVAFISIKPSMVVQR